MSITTSHETNCDTTSSSTPKRSYRVTVLEIKRPRDHQFFEGGSADSRCAEVFPPKFLPSTLFSQSFKRVHAIRTKRLLLSKEVLFKMAAERRNAYLDADVSDESDHDTGYDSEAAEISKAGRARANKRRKVEHNYTDEEDVRSSPESLNENAKIQVAAAPQQLVQNQDHAQDGHEQVVEPEDEEQHDEPNVAQRDLVGANQEDAHTPSETPPLQERKFKKDKKKPPTPGVIYLSSLPPYLKPSALRNLLSQRGFTPITRLFLSPASKSNKAHSSGPGSKNSRQLYTEGWIEFASKSTAKRCAETLNATTVGGKKGGYYRDDVWNMKYLRGMRWEELMAGVREEKREMEGRRDEERRVIARETKAFVEGVEEGRRREGMKRKRGQKLGESSHQGGGSDHRAGDDTAEEVKRTWRQNQVKGKAKDHGGESTKISEDVRQVLGKIF